MQTFYEKNVEGMLYGMGVGSGEAVASSGEKTIFSMLTRVLPPPYCIFDAGANEGQFVEACCSMLQGKDFTIHSFEPVEATFRRLADKYGNTQGVRLNRVALGAREEERSVFYNPKATGLASLSKRELSHLGIEVNASETTNVQTVEKYCMTNEIRKIDLLKIDVEGHELDVLRGANDLFNRQAVKLVMFEFGGTHIDTRVFFKDYWQFFSDHSFHLYRVTPTGYLRKIARYREILELFLTTNFVAVRNELVL